MFMIIKIYIIIIDYINIFDDVNIVKTAKSGWNINVNEYSEPRESGPFSIFDTITECNKKFYNSNNLITFQHLDIHWSPEPSKQTAGYSYYLGHEYSTPRKFRNIHIGI